jgi:hypothetical protein
MNDHVRQNDLRNGNSIALVRERNAVELDKVSMDFYEGACNSRQSRRDLSKQANEQIRMASAQ